MMKELICVQQQLKAPKNQRNKFGGYNYRSCEDILTAVKPILEMCNCYLTLVDEIVLIGDRFYVKATATIVNETGEAVSTCAYAREEESKKGMDASQLTGATSSYARKYALNGLFCIDDMRDADATNTGDQAKPQTKKPAPKETDIADALNEALFELETTTKENLKTFWGKWTQKCPQICGKGAALYVAIQKKFPKTSEQ